MSQTDFATPIDVFHPMELCICPCCEAQIPSELVDRQKFPTGPGIADHQRVLVCCPFCEKVWEGRRVWAGSSWVTVGGFKEITAPAQRAALMARFDEARAISRIPKKKRAS